MAGELELFIFEFERLLFYKLVLFGINILVPGPCVYINYYIPLILKLRLLLLLSFNFEFVGQNYVF
jgi:hypothetical protein